MRWLIGICSCACLLACAAFATAEPDGKEIISQRYTITQQQTDVSAGVFVRDQVNDETISVISNANAGGTFIAFYKGKSTYPKLAISANGIQVYDENKQVRIIDLRELASLDTSGSTHDEAVQRSRELVRATRENAGVDPDVAPLDREDAISGEWKQRRKNANRPAAAQ